jgi:hypothetical protein
MKKMIVAVLVLFVMLLPTCSAERVFDLRQVKRDLEYLRRVGIITDDWRNDPLLPMPEYDLF